MAITRSQQAKQMLREGGRIGLKKGTDRLSYSAQQTSAGRTKTSSPKSTGPSFSNLPSGEDRRQTYSAIQTQTGKVKGGGKGIGTDKRGNVVFEDDRPSQTAIDNARKFQEEQKQKRKQRRSRTFNPFPLATTALDKISNSKLAKYNNLLQRNNYFRTLNTDQQVALLEALAREEEIGTLNPMGITRNIDRGLEEGILGIGGGKFITDINFGGKDAKETINKTIEQYNKDLAEGKLKRNASVVLGDDQPALTYDEYLENQMTRFDPGPSDDPTDPCKGPNPPAYCFIGDKADETQEAAVTRNLSGLTPRIGGSIFNFDNMADGGIAGMDREAFLLGGIAKGLKKAVRGVKKLVKSPVGKMALGAAIFSGGFGLGGLQRGLFGITAKGQALRGFPELAAKKGLLAELGLTGGYGSFMPTIKGGILGASLLSGLTAKEDKGDEELAKYLASQKLEPSQSIKGMGSEFDFYGGERMRVADGGDVEPVAKKTMPLLDMDGKEKDYRETGGFVDMGRMERADDVPARLSKNEFVFTADAVRNAGEGDIDKGAEVMYNMMKNLEAGGEVSEESQGLEGARKMFQTSQRLGEVI